MGSHMKTTVVIPDALLREVQALAAKEGSTLKALIQESLRDVVIKRKRQKPVKLEDMSYPPAHLVTEKVEPKSWEEIRAIIYEGRGE
jgi:metal-responsive CopG/Arc/MetJ family transcriptional regulator